MAVLDTGGSTSGKANVDATFNLNVNMPTAKDTAGFALLGVQTSDSTVSAKSAQALTASALDKLGVGLDTPIFTDYFPGTAINTTLWRNTNTTFTTTVAGGYATLNAGASVANAGISQLRTYRWFPQDGQFGTRVDMELQFSSTPLANNQCEWGWHMETDASTAAPLDGAYFLLNSSQELRCVVNNNTTISQSAPLSFATLVGTATTRIFGIEIHPREVRFFIDRVLVATIAKTAAGALPTAAQSQPLYFRVQNLAALGVAQTMKIASVSVALLDSNSSKPYQHIIAGSGGNLSQGQTGGTLGTTAVYANSTNPAAVVPTNTTAALGSGLGGQFWETVSLAVNTDGIIQSYQNPAGTVAIPGRTLFITGIGISSYVQTVVVGGPYIAQWSLAYGHTSVSLATAEAAAAKAPRRFPIPYTQLVAAAQAVSTKVGTDFWMSLDTPIVVHPSEFLALVTKHVGTVGTTGTVAHVITYSGYWV